MSNNRYMEIDSTFRNRNQFPNPAEFDVQISVATKSTGIEALDPILDAFPIHPIPESLTVVFAAGTTAAIPILDATASIVNNFYINDILEWVNPAGLPEFRTILGYVGATQTVTLLDSPFSGNPVGDRFQIRRGIPCEQGSTVTAAFGRPPLAGGSLSTFVLPATSSDKDNFYTKRFIFLPSHPAVGPPQGQFRVITSYDGATRTGTVAPNWIPAAFAGLSYEILDFTTDNMVPVSYSGSLVSQQQMVCYEVELISLILPNELLFSGDGGLPSFLPFVYVELRNISGASGGNKNIIYSNNPNATRALFKAPMDDVPTPLISRFLKIDGDGMVQTIKFKPNDSFHIRIFLGCGDLFLNRPDNPPPIRPDPFLQISATFSMRRV